MLQFPVSLSLFLSTPNICLPCGGPSQMVDWALLPSLCLLFLASHLLSASIRLHASLIYFLFHLQHPKTPFQFSHF